MQCKPVAELLSDEKWSFEIKFDGYRCVAVKRKRGRAILAPRKGAQQTPSDGREGGHIARG
jgi:ATP-dependent DNA ligase